MHTIKLKMKNTNTNSIRKPPPRGKRNDYHGSHWIRQERRLAIYLRDGLACCYCNTTVEEDILTLDHIIPYSKGGTNLSHNLVTACKKCNCSRGDRSIEDFAQAVSSYLDTTAAQILSHIHITTKSPVDISAAKELIRRRGSYQAALHKEE